MQRRRERCVARVNVMPLQKCWTNFLCLVERRCVCVCRGRVNERVMGGVEEKRIGWEELGGWGEVESGCRASHETRLPYFRIHANMQEHTFTHSRGRHSSLSLLNKMLSGTVGADYKICKRSCAVHPDSLVTLLSPWWGLFCDNDRMTGQDRTYYTAA